MSEGMKAYRTVSNYYNLHKHEDTLNILKRRDKTIHNSKNKSGDGVVRGGFCVDANGAQKRVDFTIVSGFIKCKTNFSIKLNDKTKVDFQENEKLSPWDVYVIFEHAGNELAAINLFSFRFLRVELPHIKVGGNLFVKFKKPTTKGDEIEAMKTYSRQALKEKFGSGYIEEVHDYDDFVMFPDNKNYRPVIGNCYNHYSRFMHKPSSSFTDESIRHSMGMIKHIFGEQWELGLIYMQQIYLHPMQRLPILGLTSKENKTGKSTFGRWLRAIYGYNTVTIGPKELNSDFSASYGKSNIVIIDEANFQEKKTLENIKSLATADTLLINEKGINNYDIEWFAKILMFSNDENDFVNISKQETRYWIRKVPAIPGGANDEIHNILRDEIPDFLAMLESLPHVESQGRTFFADSDIQTEELTKTKKNSENRIYREVLDRLSIEGEQNPKEHTLYFRADEFRDRFYNNDKLTTINVVRKALRDENWQMDKSPNLHARCWSENQSLKPSKTYSYLNPHWEGLTEDQLIQNKKEQDEVPF